MLKKLCVVSPKATRASDVAFAADETIIPSAILLLLLLSLGQHGAIAAHAMSYQCCCLP
jgi:hypothetical protein